MMKIIRTYLASIFVATALVACGGGGGDSSSSSGTSSSSSTTSSSTSPVKAASTSYLNAKASYSGPITFPSSVIDSLNGPPSAYAVADFFQTGNLDLFTAFQNYHTPSTGYAGNSQSEAVSNLTYSSDFTFWRKQSNGSYSQLSTVKGCLHPKKALVVDFNQDGFPDIWIACIGYDSGTYPGEQSRLLLSDGKGGFNQSSVDTVGYHHGSAAADINGDGYPDVVSTEFSKPMYALINNKNGTFTRDDSRITGSVKDSYTAIELVDLDGDGNIDLVAGRYPEAQYANSTKIFYGNGSGSFGARYAVIPPVSGRGVVVDFIAVTNNQKKGLFIDRSSDGTLQACFFCSTTLQWVDLSDMSSKLVLDNVVGQLGPKSWTYWWIPSTQNGQNGVVPFWSVTNTFVYQ